MESFRMLNAGMLSISRLHKPVWQRFLHVQQMWENGWRQLSQWVRNAWTIIAVEIKNHFLKIWLYEFLVWTGFHICSSFQCVTENVRRTSTNTRDVRGNRTESVKVSTHLVHTDNSLEHSTEYLIHKQIAYNVLRYEKILTCQQFLEWIKDSVIFYIFTLMKMN